MGLVGLNQFVFVVSVMALNGIFIGVRPQVFNSLVKSQIPDLEEKIKLTQFPKAVVPLVKNKDFATDFAISGMEIQRIDIPMSSFRVSFTNSEDIVVEASDISVSVKFDWKIQSHHKKGVLDRGDATILLEKSSILLMAQLTENMKEMLKPIKSEFIIGDIQINFDKTIMRDLINWGISTIKGKISQTIESSVNSALSSAFKQYLSLTSLSSERMIDITRWLSLNLTLADLPSIDEDSFSVFLNGTFKHKTKNYEIPEKNPKFIEYQSERQISLFISEFSINSLSLAYFHQSPFSVSNHDLGVELTTNHLEIVFTNVTSAFGKNVAVELNCFQNDYLTLGIEKNILNVLQKLLCSVQCENGKIGDFSVDLKALIEITVASGVLRGKFLNVVVDDLNEMEFYTEEVPDMDGIKSFLNGLLLFAKPIISFKVFGTGILIPSFIMKEFEELEVSLEDSFIKVEGDFNSHNN
jgi:hypothetical protein